MPQEGFIRRNPATNATNIPQSWRQLDHGVTTLALDLGVHLHHIVSFLTNCKPLELVAKEDHLGNVTNVVDNVNCIVKYSNGMICSMWFGKSALGYRNGLRVRLFGTEGAAEWTQTDPENLYLCDKYGSKRTIDRSDPENLVANLPRYCRFKPGHPAGFIEAFANYYADIAEAIAGQNVSHRYVAGIDTALESMHFLEAISISSRSNRWEPIPHRT
jgi:predicted dehydrogenase